MRSKVIFVVLFIIGGLVGVSSLPEFEGRFFITGIIVAIFGTGAGNLKLKCHI